MYRQKAGKLNNTSLKSNLIHEKASKTVRKSCSWARGLTVGLNELVSRNVNLSQQ